MGKIYNILCDHKEIERIIIELKTNETQYYYRNNHTSFICM